MVSKMNIKSLGILFLFTAVLFATGCNILSNNLKNVDLSEFRSKNQTHLDSLLRSMGMNATLGVSDTVRFLANNASNGLLQGLKGFSDTLDPDVKKVVDRLGSLTEKELDSIMLRAKVHLRDLKGEIKDKELADFLLKIVEDATGKLKKQTRSALSDMIQKALNDFDAETANEKLQIILQGALGDSTKVKAQELVSGALQPTVDSIMKRIEKIVHKDVPFVQKQAKNLLFALAALAALIIGWVWYQRRRYARLVSILTYQIDKIPSQELYDELTKRIRNETQKEALEPLLRETLKESGINT
jgi:hypothetical protein